MTSPDCRPAAALNVLVATVTNPAGGFAYNLGGIGPVPNGSWTFYAVAKNSFGTSQKRLLPTTPTRRHRHRATTVRCSLSVAGLSRHKRQFDHSYRRFFQRLARGSHICSISGVKATGFRGFRSVPAVTRSWVHPPHLRIPPLPIPEHSASSRRLRRQPAPIPATPKVQRRQHNSGAPSPVSTEPAPRALR